MHERAGDHQPLPLAAGERAAALAAARCASPSASPRCRRRSPAIRAASQASSSVSGDEPTMLLKMSPGMQPPVLQHHADLPAHRLHVEPRQVLAVVVDRRRSRRARSPAAAAAAWTCPSPTGRRRPRTRPARMRSDTSSQHQRPVGVVAEGDVLHLDRRRSARRVRASAASTSGVGGEDRARAARTAARPLSVSISAMPVRAAPPEQAPNAARKARKSPVRQRAARPCRRGQRARQKTEHRAETREGGVEHAPSRVADRRARGSAAAAARANSARPHGEGAHLGARDAQLGDAGEELQHQPRRSRPCSAVSPR